jgi:peptide deformylase
VELKIYPDRVLRRKCSTIREITDETWQHARRMLEFMYEAQGAGLAGPQVGWLERIITLDVEGTGEGRRIWVNPRIVETEGAFEHEEGCLSLPGLYVKVLRAQRVTVVAYTLEGERVEIEAEGLPACAWQHELDHLNGILTIDRLSPAQQITLRRRLKKLEEAAAEKER